MKLGIISDTHGCLTTWNSIFARFLYDADLLIHAGDILYHGPRNPIPQEYNPKQLAEVLNECPIPIVAACGNCDAEVDAMVLDFPIQAPYAYLVINGRKIVVCHGHNLNEEQTMALTKKYQVNLFITGHTHVADLKKRNNTLFLNPGSPSMSKRSDCHGTLALINDNHIEVLDITTGKALFSDCLE